MKYKDEATARKYAMLAARRRAKLEAKAKAFDKIKALIEHSDQDGVLARIREVIQEVQATTEEK